MRVACIIGFAFTLLSAGCSGIKPASPAAQPSGAAEAAAPAPSMAPGPSAPMIAKPVAPLVPEAVNPPVAPREAARGDLNAAPPAKAPAPVAPRSRAGTPAKKESTAPDATKQASPTLDLTSLEQRLKDTKAIGVLTKIELKNQVDDLLDQFRAFYQGKLKTTLAELRRPYDRLVMKVLTLLQDSDPTLAATIVASREAIWGILSDPVKFATI